MKKLLSIFLILPFLFFSTSCAEGKIQYKTVTFKHAEILQEQLELTFPNDWIYEEICDGNDKEEVKNMAGDDAQRVNSNIRNLKLRVEAARRIFR